MPTPPPSDGYLYYNAFNGTEWLGQDINITNWWAKTRNTPALAVYDGKLYMANTRYGNLYYFFWGFMFILQKNEKRSIAKQKSEGINEKLHLFDG